MVNPIAAAIPFFFLGIFIEARVARARHVRIYRLADALANLGCGIGQQLAGLFVTGLLIATYSWLYDGYRLVTLPVWAGWALAVVGVDFVYYWWHRLSHEVNLLWAGHGVHHQSEDYNLAVALRQSVVTSLTFFPFLAVLAFAGVPPLQVAVVNSVSTLYQFWIHTELVGRLPLFERLFNSPSLHRVHHAINPKYLDRNHGATFIIWDRLFGTFQPEEEQCVYGMTRQLSSYNSLWAQFDGFWYLLRLARHAPNPLEALKVFVMSPAWRAPWFPDPKLYPIERREQQQKYDPQAPRGRRVWAVSQTVLLVFATLALLIWGPGLTVPARAAAVGLVYLTLFNIGGLLENRAWVVPFEVARWTMTAASVGLFVTGRL